MLSAEEKQNLYKIITVAIGDYPGLKENIQSFNEQTVDIAEQMLHAGANCNRSMKDLLVGLIDVKSMVVKGWLRKSLKKLKRDVKKSEMNGLACMVSTKARWRSSLELTYLM